MKIGINCGHTLTGAGSGAVGYISESEQTRIVGWSLTQKLDNGGHTIIDCTVDRANTQKEYLKKTVEIANANNLDLFVSIHFNAGGGQGVEVYTYGGKQHTEAVRVCEKLHALGFKNRGVKDGSGLYVIGHTTAKAMLIEVCFCDNKADTELYKSIGENKIAAAIAEAITGQSIGGVTMEKSIFTDVPTTDAAYEDIKNLKDYGIINGYSDGTFRPDAPITRREMAIIINRLFAYID